MSDVQGFYYDNTGTKRPVVTNTQQRTAAYQNAEMRNANHLWEQPSQFEVPGYTDMYADYEPNFMTPEYRDAKHRVTQPRLYVVKNPKRNWKPVIISAIAGLVIIVGLIAIVLSYHKQAHEITAVAQPLSAGQVASQLGCTDFTEFDPGSSGMVVTAGTCMKGGVKYAIDTFASQAVRDEWLKAAEPLGVVPVWESDTSVTYKSTDK